jgi:Glu-tRNA(Gln) amidotransferase subunit E-like FAD-binding protein
VKEWNVNPTAAAVFLIQYPKRLKKKGLNIGILNEEIFTNVLKSFADGKIPGDAVLNSLNTILKLGLLVENVILSPAKEDEVNNVISESIEKINNISLNDEINKETLLMGAVMNKLRGKIPAPVIAGIIGFRKKGISNVG